MQQALPDGRSSNNQIPVLDMVWTLFALVLTGGRRFAHAKRLRQDRVLQGILGARRVPSAMTLTRFFGGLLRAQVEHEPGPRPRVLGLLRAARVWRDPRSARGADEFLKETLALLPEDLRLRGLRADSGFFELRFLKAVEAQRLAYAIAVDPCAQRQLPLCAALLH